MKLRFSALCLSVILLVSLCACVAEKEDDRLVGTWSLIAVDTPAQAEKLLSHSDLYEEEIAVVNKNNLCIVKTLQFSGDKTYRFGYDTEGTKACVRKFYTEVFSDLYTNRSALTGLYEEDISNLSQEDFYLFYAKLYGTDSFSGLIEKFTNISYDYQALAQNTEAGTYKIVGEKLLTTKTGESMPGALTYEIDGSTLTLHYSDATETYTKTEN